MRPDNSHRLSNQMQTYTVKDIVSGVVTSIVIVATTLSYSALIFSGSLADTLSLGIGFGLISAGLTAIVFAAASGLPFAIAGPDSKPVAVLASLAAFVGNDLMRQGRVDEVGPTVLAALIAGTLIVGITSYVLGALKLGRWIRFIPFPVIGGFMAASGWLLASGGVRVLTHEPLSLRLLSDLASGHHLAQLSVGVAFALALRSVQRINHPLAFPGLLIAGTAAILFGLAAAGVSAPEARETGWLLSLHSSASLPGPWLLGSLSKIDTHALLGSSGEYAALIIVTAATLLLGIMAIEVETKIDVDLDHELKLNGLANMFVGLGGGMLGTLSVSRTLFSYRMGARGRASGMLAGAICLLPLVFGHSALGFVPVPILGGLLLQLGADMLDEWLIKGWSKMQRADYVQLVAIFLAIAWLDFVAGVGVGIIAACITFAVNTSRIRLVKLGTDRSSFASRVDRPLYQAEELVRHGENIQIMWLHGFIFFGSAHRLLMQIKAVLATHEGACRSLILDFRQVLGIDSSAVMSLMKLRHFAEREGFTLVLSDVPPNVERSLRKGGILSRTHDPVCCAFVNLDSALEWCEDNLLAHSANREEEMRSAEEWLTAELGAPHLFRRLMPHLSVIELQPGDFIFTQGQAGDSLYLLASGRVTILFRASEGQEVRLRSMLGHTLLGEMGLYRVMPRGASVRVDEPTVVFRLSQATIDQLEREDPALAHAFHKFVIRTLASRLDFANREVASLQR